MEPFLPSFAYSVKSVFSHQQPVSMEHLILTPPTRHSTIGLVSQQKFADSPPSRIPEGGVTVLSCRHTFFLPLLPLTTLGHPFPIPLPAVAGEKSLSAASVTFSSIAPRRGTWQRIAILERDRSFDDSFQPTELGHDVFLLAVVSATHYSLTIGYGLFVHLLFLRCFYSGLKAFWPTGKCEGSHKIL